MTEEQTKPTAADLLETAAEVLEVGGWVRGTLYHDGASCALGAIRNATSRLYRKDKTWDRTMYWMETRGVAVRMLADVVVDRFSAQQKPLPRDTVVIWNDEQAKDQYQVIDAMKLAAKHYRSMQRYPDNDS